MFATYFEAGGPLMFAVLAAWIIVLAGVLDRVAYFLGAFARRPFAKARALARVGRLDDARELHTRELARAARGLTRIEAVSQLATSIGLFGTVVGIAGSFFARGAAGGLAAPEALAEGLSTALYTTVAGLVVFLFGQTASIAFREWIAFCRRDLDVLLDTPVRSR